MSLEVVHRDDRNAKPKTEALRARYADEECSDQPRPRGDGDLLDVLPGRTPIGECPAHERKEMLQGFTRRDLRHHATERLMTVDLGRDEVHAHASIAIEERD